MATGWRKTSAEAPRTITMKMLRQKRLALMPDHPRPKLRGECVNGTRPCPYVGCRYHLYLDVKESSGSITLNYPRLEPHQLLESCALDVAENGNGMILEAISELMGLTRERVRQIEASAIARCREKDVL